MFRIAALNESGSSEGSQGDKFVKESTKEAKEAEAYALYHKALGLLRNGNGSEAEDVFRDLIHHDFLQEAQELLEEKGNEAIHPGLQLGYSIHKNLAAMATKKNNYSSAMESYLEAVKIDGSEVTVWYKMGMVALKLEDFQLAKLAFEQGLECNPKHWPCLDHIITLMYALNNYIECIYFISQAFELQVQYEKGHALRDKIFREQPSMKGDTEEFFELCDPEVLSFHLDEAIAKEYVEEALQIRRRRQELSKPPEPVILKFPPRMKEYSWKHVGEVLLDMFDTALDAEPRVSFCLKVDVPDYTNVLAETEERKERHPTSDDGTKNKTEVEPDVEMKEETKSSGEVSVESKGESDSKNVAIEISEDKPGDNNQEEEMEVVSLELVEDNVDSVDGVNELKKETVVKDEIIKIDDNVMIKVTRESDSDTAGKAMEGDKATEDTSGPVVDDESDSVMEAINVAHSLLDSLSPVKSGPHSNSQPDTSAAIQKDVKQEIPKIAATEAVPRPDDRDENRQVSRTTSLGFSVANILSPDGDKKVVNVDKSSELPVVTSAASNGTMFTSTPVTAASAVSSSSVAASLTSISETVQTQPNTTSAQLLASSSVTIQTSTVAITSSTLLSTAPVRSLFPSAGTADSSGVRQSESKQIDDSSLTGSLLPSRPLSSQQGTNQPVSMSSTATPARTDHGYSKSYESIPTNNVPSLASQGSGGFVPGFVNSAAGESFPQKDAIPVVQSLQSSSAAMEIDDRGQRKVHKRRRISHTTEELMMYGKRRSARVSVRNTGRKKEEETVNFYELLQAFLPSSLKSISEEEDSMYETPKDDPNLPDITPTSDSNSEEQMELMETCTDTWNEEVEVRAYLDRCLKNQGLAHMMRMYLLTLARHCKVKWNGAVRDIYLGIFRRIRKSMYVPNVFNDCDSEKDFQIMSQIFLVMLELQLDKWLAQGNKNIMSPASPTSQVLQERDIPACFNEDVLSLTVLCSQSDRLGSLWIDHSVRVYWMKARYSMLRGHMEEAVACFERACEYLEYGKEEESIQHVSLPNCTVDNVINLRIVRGQQDLLQKSCSGEETQRWYEQGEYEKVVEVLLQSFSQPIIKSKMVKMMSDPGERRTQLTVLQDALYKTGNFKRCIIWGEESFHEAYQSFVSSSSVLEQTEWVNTMVVIFKAVLRVVSSEKLSIIQSLPSKKLMRFSQNLMRLIDSNMSLPENVTEMVVDTVLPWILLFHILKDEEDKLETLRLKESHSSDDLDDEAMSSSHMLLNIAHDYLGSRSWCTKSDGALLHFFMSVLRTRIEAESRFQEEYQQAFEQCVYCLYGHPNKKGKAKHLQEHNAPSVILEWEQAVQVFDYFKPKSLPEFDGYKSETISSEIEFLLKRITPLIHEKYKTIGLNVEDIQNFIEGNSNVPPAPPEGSKQDLPIVGEIYYLLADYYLKNKETLKAIKFYLQDVCINPTRLDSWAGMALARMSQLDAKLTSADLKMDAPIYKKSVMALRCFKRAVEIDDTNVKLWIEYGTLAYQLHSHASRQIKWKKWFAMDEDTVQIAVESKREMLQTALNCFKKAGQCQREWSEDEWLHTYMHGKCNEKLRKPIHETADFFLKTLEYLHEDGAKYPKKIVFSYTTPHLAVEALEMYFRVHSLVIKTLLKHEAGSDQLDYRVLANLIFKAAQSPFAGRGEKEQGSNVESESCSSAEENSCSTSSLPTKKRSAEKSQIDHTYFRQKSSHSNHGEEPPLSDFIPSSKSVTTLELHSEGDPVLTTTTTHHPDLPEQESIQQREATDGQQTASPAVKPADGFAGGAESLVTEKDFGRAKGDDHDFEIMELLKKMTEIVEANIANKATEKDTGVGSTKTGTVATETSVPSSQSESAPVAMETEEEERNLKETADSKDEQSQEDKLKEAVDTLLKKPVPEIHRELIDRCRQAFELCLRRFPTHYKSHYRLAHLYMNSPYHKDLPKAHHILLGTPKWQQLPYMPCQGLFGDRKQTKFFQGIWKIPIDEIDRSGSFPSHLNRCIGLTLQLLKEQKDSQTLHHVHLQLNRQPEPGKKYLRDAEKKYYALTSHRFTLDSIEMQIESMKKTTDPHARLRFLMTVHKVREHGVNKLNKLPERTNKLLAEAYRVVLRKLETLPHQMLLDQALRFCSHQLSQKSVSKAGAVGTQPSGTSSMSTVDSSRPPVSQPDPSTPGTGHTIAANAASATPKVAPSTEANNSGANQTPSALSSKVSDRVSDEDVVVISDSSDVMSPVKKSMPGPPVGSETAETKAPTVKIKMGLLQAVKRLKPVTTEVLDSSADERLDKPLFSDFSISAPSEDESEVPIPSASEKEDDDESSSSSSSDSSSESSGSDSSSDSSSSDSESEDEEKEGAKKAEKVQKAKDDSDAGDDDGKEDDNAEIDDDTADDKDNTTADESAIESGQVTAATTDDDGDDEAENDSSDDDDEVDLVSSDNEGKDDDKDKDYMASDDGISDEDVIMISDEEFGPKGRTVIPSPPHKKKVKVVSGVEKEVLVESIPDFVPFIDDMMLSNSPATASQPIPVGPPVPAYQPQITKPSSSGEKTVPMTYEILTIDSD